MTKSITGMRNCYCWWMSPKPNHMLPTPPLSMATYTSSPICAEPSPTLISSYMIQPLEDSIRSRLIPALTGRAPPCHIDRELLALPARLGGLGIVNPTKLSSSEYLHGLRQHLCPAEGPHSRTEPRVLFRMPRSTSQCQEGCSQAKP